MSSTIGQAGKRVFANFIPESSNHSIDQTNAIPALRTPVTSSSLTSLSTSNSPLTAPNSSVTIRREFSNQVSSKSTLNRVDSFNLDDLAATLEECRALDDSQFGKQLDTYSSDKVNANISLITKSIDKSVITASQSKVLHSASKGNDQVIKPVVSSPLLEPKSDAENGLSSDSSMTKEQLLFTIAQLKKQNTILHSSIEITRQESVVLIERERQQRVQMVEDLEQKNKQLLQELIEAKLHAEQKLEEEKDTFINALKRMEEEKLLLKKKIDDAEEIARNEAGFLKMQALDMEKRVKELSVEKESAMRRVQEIQSKSESSTQETQELLGKLEIMEKEKRELLSSLHDNEALAKEAANRLEAQLQCDKELQQHQLLQMEKEKQELTDRLLAAEKAAKAQATAMKRQLDLQNSAADALIYAMETEKKYHKEDVEEQRVPTVEETAVLREISNEEESLKYRLKNSAEQAKAKVQDLAERLKERQRRRLNKTVDKLKEENLQEPASDSSVTQGKQLRSISSKKSLLNMMTDTKQVSPAASRKITRHSSAHSSSSAATSSSFALLGASDSSGAEYTILGEGSMLSNEPRRNSKANLARKKTFRVAGTDAQGELGKTFMDDDSDEEDSQRHNGMMENEPELPAPHAAAAAGDIKRLKMLHQLDSALLESIDSLGRMPLFYACAHGHLDAVVYLLSLASAVTQVRSQDIYGDTALHAASAAGSKECIRHIFLVGSQFNEGEGEHPLVNVENATGMTPTHLAGNVESLELLCHFGANINVLDKQERTPLFIACALNRADCANFLIGCIDHTDEELLRRDYRGDTPLHAASCNGAVDCLLVLLQYGIDPRLQNNQGMQAMDLAARNKQHKCREILAEYQLHYCTSSEFDSVLFLATLEGHRIVSQAISTRKSQSLAHGLAGQFAFQSMFSLRGNQSMRLQRYGPWIAYHDSSTGSVFWYNHEAGQGQWEKPEAIAHWEASAAAAAADIFSSPAEDENHRYNRTLQAKMSMRLKKDGDWIQYITERGRAFYYNERTGKFQWTDPHTSSAAFPPLIETDRERETDRSTARGGDTSRHQGAIDEGAELSTLKEEDSEWKAYLDDATGAIFWYNTITKVSQWENPFEAQVEEDDGAYLGYDMDGAEADGGYEAVAVNGDEDLGI